MQVKGVSIKNCQDYIESKYGKEKWGEIIKDLPQSSKEHLPDGVVFPSNWYPVRVFVDVNEVMLKKYGSGNGRIIRDAAKYGAMNNLKTVYRIFMKVATVDYVVKKAAVMFSQFYDFGHMKHIKSDGSNIVLHLENVPELPMIFERVAGYMEGVIASTSARSCDVKYDYLQHDRRAVFDVRYSK